MKHFQKVGPTFRQALRGANRRSNLAVAAILLLLTACAHQPTFEADGPRQDLFPPGVYYHDVKFKVGEEPEREVKGVMRLTPTKLLLVGLGPMQATLFKIQHDRKTDIVTLDIFEGRLEKLRESILDFYKSLSKALLHPLKSEEERPETVAHRDGFVLLTKYDKNGIPRRLSLQNPKFDLVIDVTDYNVGPTP